MKFISLFCFRRFPLYLFLLFLMFPFIEAQGQQIEARVSVMLELLPLEKQQELKDLADEIESYINDYDWTGEVLEEPIKVIMKIFLRDRSVSYENRYSGRFLISNEKDIQYYDRYWYFPFEAGNQLIHSDDNFDPFTRFIDFYIYLIIGGEYDKFGKFMGTPYFEKAKHITELAQFNTVFFKGWKERGELANYILSDENIPFRTMKDFFFLGLSYVGEEDTTAKRYCGKALSILEDILTKDPGNKKSLQFIHGHRMELIEIFKDDPDVIKRLMKLDPDNSEYYLKHIHNEK